MLIRSNQMQSETRTNMRGGDGDVEILHLVDKVNMPTKARLMAKVTLQPGCSIGYHVHEKETEIYYFTAGIGQADDDGTVRDVAAGDVMITAHCGHAVKNTGNEPLEFTAVIIKD